MDTYLIVVEHVNGAEELILLQDAVVVGVDGGKDLEGIDGLRRGDGPLGILGGSEGAKRQLLLARGAGGVSGHDGARGEVDKARSLADHGCFGLIEAVDVGVRSFGFVGWRLASFGLFNAGKIPQINDK